LLNILLIDDSSEYRALLGRLITENYPGARVEEYDPDLKGIPETSMNWNGYSMVLLDYDLGLEIENGLDWLQILKTYPDMPPIVILTSNNNSAITVRALNLGAANYLLKTDVNVDNIISRLAESFELAKFHESALESVTQPRSLFNDDGSFIATVTPAIEGTAGEETLAPEMANIFDDDDNKLRTSTVAIRAESFESTTINISASINTTQSPGVLNNDGTFIATEILAIEDTAGEETLAPEMVNIFDKDDDESLHSDGVCLLIPGYTIEKEIAKGGMSTVLLAKRLEDDLSVVLKVLFTQGQEDPSALKRFMQEYNLISAMDHPHVIRIYERAFATDFAYIALEYLPTGDLSKRIQRGIAAETALSYLKQIALGLGAIHELNIIHRDLKPGNILFYGEDTLKITDFGAAKIISDEMEDITLNDMVVGTSTAWVYFFIRCSLVKSYSRQIIFQT
jgi:ActR/RegA family two-component response regulator